MNLKYLFVAAALSLSSAVPASSAPVAIDIKWDSLAITLYGLDNADPDQQEVTSLDVVGSFDTYTGISAIDSYSNGFVFDTDGSLKIAILDLPLTPYEVGDGSSKWLLTDVVFLYDPTPFVFAFIGQVNSDNGNTFNASGTNPTVSQRVLTPVPVPASALLLLTGISGMVVFRRRKHRGA